MEEKKNISLSIIIPSKQFVLLYHLRDSDGYSFRQENDLWDRDKSEKKMESKIVKYQQFDYMCMDLTWNPSKLEARKQGAIATLKK